MFVSGLMEGVGLTLIFPFLDLVFSNSFHSSNKLSLYIQKFFTFFNIKISLGSVSFSLFAIFLIKAFLVGLQYIFSNTIVRNISRRIKTSLLDNYSQMAYSYFVTRNIGYFANMLTIEANRFTTAFLYFCNMLALLIYILIYIGFCFWLNFSKTILMVFIFGILLLPLTIVSEISKWLSISVSNLTGEFQTLIIQFLNNFKYLKATASFKEVINNICKKLEILLQKEFWLKNVRNIFFAFVEPLSLGLILSLVFYEIKIKGSGFSSVAILIVFFYRAFSKIFGLQPAWQKFITHVGGIEVIERFKSELDANKEEDDGIVVTSFKDKLEFKNVSFSYDDRKVLEDINIKIEKNKTVGIVGPSGAGKTTLVDLIMGLYKPTKGTIFLDGISYDNINKKSLRRIIGYVLQEPAIFDDTIANNVSFWNVNKEGKCEEKIMRAIRLANAEDFVNELPEKIYTFVGEKGVKLSGGQRQRLVIARELFKQPQLVIFDEATSSLDSLSEEKIQRSIDNLKGMMTIIIITHRLSAVKNADYIYVLEKGRIVEEGTFKELYENKTTRFAQMCQLQSFEF